ncbi:MAG: BamA/TamA family outer membrane protein [bacterium]
MNGLKALLLLFAGLASCAAPARVIVGDGSQIETVEFEGVSRLSKGDIVKHLYAGERGWLPDNRDQPYDEALIAADAERIEQFYAAQGYYDARVEDVRTSRDGDEVTVTFVVFEGEPTNVRRLSFVWSSQLDAKARARVEAAAALTTDQAFAVSDYNETLGALRFAMLTEGYPLAEVSGAVNVDRDAHVADCEFTLTPGPRATIAGVTFEGLVDVPQDQVHREIEFALGEPYSPARVAQMETAVKGLRVFRWVSTVPPTEVIDGKVVLVMRVSEADPQSIRIGAEVEVDTVRWQEQARIGYTHTNVFGELTRLDLTTILGWAQLPNPWETDLQGPVVTVRPELTKKGLLERHLMWSFAPQYKLDLEEGYQYHSISDRFGVSRWFKGVYRVGLNHQLDYVNFFNLSPSLDPTKSLLGRDFRDPYLLSVAEAQAAAFFVDSITKPQNGVILETSYGVASSKIGSDFDFQRAVVQARGYWRVKPWFQIASRAKSGLIVPFGDNPSVPFNKRFYLGGANSVRGWGSRRLSPRIEECDDTGTQCDSIPVGGYTLIQGNLELRFRVAKPLWVVAFSDMGDVQAQDLTFDVTQWNYSAGPGVRVDTPLGLVRLDVGFRLNETGVYPDENTWGVYFGLGETL